MKLYSARELFELRRIPSVKPRVAYVRLFEIHGKAGLCDGSGTVWPISLAGQVPPLSELSGCIFQIEMRLSWQSGTQPSASEIETLKIHVIGQVAGRAQTPWLTPVIPDPRSHSVLVDVEPTTQKSLFRRNACSQRLTHLKLREELMAAVRSFFGSAGYREFDPPTLVASGGVERYLNSFQTEYLDHRNKLTAMQLPTSPEFSLKKLVTEGCARLYAMTHAFRNQGELARHHEPEFLMLEWYRVGESFESLMIETQSLVEKLAIVSHSDVSLPAGHWPQFTVHELFKKLAHIDLAKMSDAQVFQQSARPLSPSIVDTDTWDDVFCKLFMELVEPFLAQQKACFVTQYPARMGALAALNAHNPFYVDRFELYINGIEICNGYRELVDGVEYARRVAETRTERPEVFEDPLFENCFAVGMYPCVGNALGLDRLISLFLRGGNLQSSVPWPFASRFPAGSIALE
jgi:lysyl-tRNA synthetase class 2